MSVQELVPYTSFQGENLELTPWPGEHVVLLTDTADLDVTVVGKILNALDHAWEYYTDVTGREPTPNSTSDGLATIAVVQNTCGAGCGFLGFTGIEIMPEFFQTLYEGVQANDQYDQVLFYELGRNFWFYNDQLGSVDAFVTGFAVVNRFLSMQAAEVEGAPFRGQPLDEFNENQLQDLPRLYFKNPELNWHNTLESDTGLPGQPFGLGAADLAASLIYRIHEDFGRQDYASFWHALSTLPTATTPEDAISNFVAAAEQATGIDYGFLFKEGWTISTGSSGSDRLTVHTANTGERAALAFQGDDTIIGSRQADTLEGGLGDDHLKGRAGDDVLLGGPGDDHLKGGSGADILAAGIGRDFVKGGAGNDLGVFELSADELASGSDYFDGGPGKHDRLKLDLTPEQASDEQFQRELASFQEQIQHGGSKTIFTFASLNGLQVKGWESVEVQDLISVAINDANASQVFSHEDEHAMEVLDSAALFAEGTNDVFLG